jgi:hypothetical protein
VIDSVEKTDVVFNYGMFEYGPDFEIKFMRGKLLYCVGVESFMDFMQEYLVAKRSVEEQVLLLDDRQKERIYSFLAWNAEPQNKYYKYDFFYDNCATRIRDIFTKPEVFGRNFHYGQALPGGKPLTFRDIMNRYFYKDHWTRLGVNILLGSRIDVNMSNLDIMFLPDYLQDGIAGATVNGGKISTPPALILPGGQSKDAGVNWALIFSIIIAGLTIAGLSFPQLRPLGAFMTTALLLVTGLLGCLILIMWFGTDHQGCSNNFNILWALPPNIIIAFFNPKGKGRYVLIAIGLIVCSLLLHVLKVQALIPELLPLLLALLFVYGTIYKRIKLKIISHA